MREGITLKCSVCGQETYRTKKNKKNTPDRIRLGKYCPKCRKRTEHVEKKK